MAKRLIDYGRLVEQALRTVVRDVLVRVAKEGLAGAHHFYITFRTDDPAVGMSSYLRERYPSEMTIVLQFQYWDLQVDDQGFAVTLSFNNVPERLEIPFSALKVFADPGAEFGLQFTIEPDGRISVPRSEGEDAAAAAEVDSDPVPLRPHQPAPVVTLPTAAPPHTEAADEPPAPEGEEGGRGGAEIVTLDRFRKK